MTALRLVVFPQDAYPENAGPHDYTRAVLNAGPPLRARRGARLRASLALACLAGVLTRSVSPTTPQPRRGAASRSLLSTAARRTTNAAITRTPTVEQDIVRALGAVCYRRREMVGNRSV